MTERPYIEFSDEEWSKSKEEYFTCPTCGTTADSLELCDYCEWEIEEENIKYSNLLTDITGTQAGDNAYLGHGCMTCLDCRDIWYNHHIYCPLQIFYNGFTNFVLPYALRDKQEQIHLVANALKNLKSLWSNTNADVTAYRKKIYDFALNNFDEHFNTGLKRVLDQFKSLKNNGSKQRGENGKVVQGEKK